MEILPNIYWIMALAGTIMTILMLFLGHGHGLEHGGLGHGLDHGGLGHGGLGHGGIGHGVGHGGGHAEAGHGQTDQGRDEGPGPISIRTILAFTGGWGWGGLIGYDVLKWGVFSAPFGLAVGFLMAVIIFRFTRFLYMQEATSTVSEVELVGSEGVVLTAIPPTGAGEIRLYARGTPLKCLARSEGGERIEAGRSITVVEEIGGTLVVRPS